MHSCVQATVQSRLSQPRTPPQTSDASQLRHYFRNQNCSLPIQVSELHSWIGCLVAVGASADAATDAIARDLITTLRMMLRSCQLPAHLASHLFLPSNPHLCHQRNNHRLFLLKLSTLSSVAYSTSSKQPQTIWQQQPSQSFVARFLLPVNEIPRAEAAGSWAPAAVTTTANSSLWLLPRPPPPRSSASWPSSCSSCFRVEAA